MLGEIGIVLLFITIVAYLVCLPVSLYSFFYSLVRKRFLHALKTLVYLVLITVATLLCILPFLKMHGSYSNLDRLGIIALCAANLGFILLLIFSRYKLIGHLKENHRRRTGSS